MFNIVPTLPIAGTAAASGGQYVQPADSVGYFSVQPDTISLQPNATFGEANAQLLQEQMMYQQMLNNILYTSDVYSGWDNIPLYNIPPMNLFPQNNFNTNPFNLNSNLFNFDSYKKEKDTSIDTSDKKVSMALIESGYDFVKGQKLANIAKKNVCGFKKKCATYAKNDIQQAGLGKYEYGNATDCDRILDRNPNFKRVDISLADLKKTPGIVLVYKAGVSGYHKKYGHIEITGGDGCAYSDGKTRNIRPGYIAYAPVSKSSKSYKA